MYQSHLSFVPGQSGFRIPYRMNETNHCPACGNTHWVVGRTTAECAFCETALPIMEGGLSGAGLFRSRGKPAFEPLAA